MSSSQSQSSACNTSQEFNEAIHVIISTIHCYLDQHENCSEHDLIRHLQDHEIPPYSQLNLRESKALFDAHFLTRHALYQLQNRYLSEETFILDLGLTKISRTLYQAGCTAITAHDPVKDYYLDIEQYLKTSEDEVDDLLKDFWKQYLAHGSKHADLDTLELPDNASYSEIKKQYRLLAQKHHPDKGGDAKRFHQICKAKENLDRLFKH